MERLTKLTYYVNKEFREGMEKAKDQGDLATDAELFKAALAFFRYALDTSERGRALISRGLDGREIEVVHPSLEFAKKRGDLKREEDKDFLDNLNI